jgi:hypothetical protein
MTPNSQALFQNYENKQIFVYDLDYFFFQFLQIFQQTKKFEKKAIFFKVKH